MVLIQLESLDSKIWQVVTPDQTRVILNELLHSKAICMRTEELSFYMRLCPLYHPQRLHRVFKNEILLKQQQKNLLKTQT